MAEPEDKWSRLQDTLTKVGGLIAAVSAFVGKALNVGGSLPQPLQWLILVAILAFGVYLWRYANRRAQSRGGDPRKLDEVLLKHAGTLGRADDLLLLLDICRTRSVTTVVGVPGVGKTASLRYGVLPQLKPPTDCLPLYLNDWSEGALQAFGRAFQRARAALPSAAPPIPQPPGQTPPTPRAQRDPADHPQQWSAVAIADEIDGIHSDTGRALLFILDEFDDYLLSTSHNSPCGRAVTLEELEPLDPVWSVVGQAVISGKARVLLARQARTEGMDPSGTRRLLPIDASYWRAIASDLVDTGFILRPDNGWAELSEKIGSDLAVNGTTLPFRIAVACRSLRNLGRPLTPGMYDRIGGLVGLEQDWLVKQVDSVLTSGADRALARQILYVLAEDRSTGAAAAAGPWTLDAISAHVQPSRADNTHIAQILKELKRQQLVRVFVSDRGAAVWGLYHPFLGLPLRRLRDREHRAQGLLDAHIRTAKLLRPRELAVVLGGIARRQATLERHSVGIIAASLLRVVVVALLIAGVVVLAVDGGLEIPGAQAIRRTLERHGCSLAAWPKSPASVHAAAKSMASDFSRIIMDRQGAPDAGNWTGWIHPDPTGMQPRAKHDYWAHAQASAAIAAADTSDRQVSAGLPEMLGVMMTSQTRLRAKDGTLLGWSHNDGERSVLAQPILWLGIAAARYHHADQKAAEQACIGTRVYWAQIDSMLDPFYHDGQWNQFLDQENPRQSSVYISALALEYLVQRRRDDQQIAGNRKIDSQLRSTFQWLTNQYVGRSKTSNEKLNDIGWREDAANGVKNAMSLQIFASMLAADAIGDPRLQIPADHYRELSAALIDWTQAGIDEPGYYKVSVHDRAVEGSFLVYDKFITYVWYPWAVQCATRWLQTARQHDVDEGTIRLIRGRLGRLIVDRSHRLVADCESRWTFFASECLYGLEAAARIYALSEQAPPSPKAREPGSMGPDTKDADAEK